MTIPEIGTITATHPPIIVLTSNRTRDLHDAVKRRCLYHWIDYPTPQREVEIVRRRVTGASETLAVQVANAVVAHARQRRAEAARHRRGDRLAGGARACSASSGSTPPPSSARSARCSSTTRTRRSSAPPASRSSCAAVTDAAPARSAWRRSSSTCRRSAGALSRRLRDAGLPVTPGARGRLRARARAGAADLRAGGCTGRRARCFVSDPSQVAAFDAVFCSVFGDRGRGDEPLDLDERAGGAGRRRTTGHGPTTGRVRGAASATGRRRRRRAGAARATRTAPRSRCRWRWPATRSGSPTKSFDAARAARAGAAATG